MGYLCSAFPLFLPKSNSQPFPHPHPNKRREAEGRMGIASHPTHSPILISVAWAFLSSTEEKNSLCSSYRKKGFVDLSIQQVYFF